LIQVISAPAALTYTSLKQLQEGNPMNLWHEFLNDPVIFISFTGLAIVIGLCIFYAVYFIYKVGNAEEQSK
jgi:preprotein translocase subunit SecY